MRVVLDETKNAPVPAPKAEVLRMDDLDYYDEDFYEDSSEGAECKRAPPPPPLYVLSAHQL